VDRWARKPMTDRRGFIIEQKIFLAAYTIRKLMEAEKFSSSFRDTSLTCRAYPSISDEITISNKYKIDELYDFNSSEISKLSISKVVNYIIHSFIFSECSNEDNIMTGFLINSDKVKYNGLYEVTLAEFLACMRTAGSDMPSASIRIFDRESKNWFVWNGHGEPPSHVQEKVRLLRAKLRQTKRW